MIESIKMHFRIYLTWLFIFLGLAIVAPKTILIQSATGKYNLLISGILLLLYTNYFTAITRLLILKRKAREAMFNTRYKRA